MKKFEICDLHTDRTYEVLGEDHHTLDIVWSSQKNWFQSGALVKITDENGESKVFEKE